MQVYVKRIEELKKTGDMVVLREVEWRDRPRAFEELAASIVHFEKILTQFKDEVRVASLVLALVASNSCCMRGG